MRELGGGEREIAGEGALLANNVHNNRAINVHNWGPGRRVGGAVTAVL